MKARASNPTTVLGCGLGAVIVLGVLVTWLSEKTPVVKLKPELEKIYGVHGFVCSLKLQENRMNVEPPSALALDRLERRRLGGLAFKRYLALTQGKTRVTVTHVLPAPEEVVTIEQESSFSLADDMAESFTREASEAAGSAAKLFIAPGSGGAVVIATVACGDADARRVGAMLQRMPNVSLVQVKRGEKVVFEWGPDAKLYGTIAPVSSRAP